MSALENKEFIEELEEVAGLIHDEAQKSFYQLGADSGANVKNDSDALFQRIAALDQEVPVTDFCHRLTSIVANIKSPMLKTALAKIITDTIEQKEAEHLAAMKKDRLANILQRENLAVRGISGISYCVYLNILSGFGSYIPVVRDVAVSVPSSYLYLGVLGILASQLTAPYESVGEAYERVCSISDRVLTNSGLRLCFTTLYNVIEKAAISSATVVQDSMDQKGLEATLPSPKPD